MKTQIKNFTEGNVTTQILKFATPLFFCNFIQIIYNMADMFIVGQVHGKVGISAVAVGGDLCNLMTFVAMGFANAGIVLVAKLIGSNRKDKLGKFTGTMSSFFMISAIIISILSIIFQDALLRFMKTPAEAYQYAADYSLICMSGLIFIYGYNMTSAVMRGMGDAKHPFIFISFAAVMNIILDYIFVVILDIGVKGAALATVMSQGTSFILSAGYLYIHRQQYELKARVRDFIIPDKEMLISLLKLGVPMALKLASVQISKLFVNSHINNYGVEVSAFAGIANKISNTANLISAAMNTTGSTIAGQNIAAGREKRVKLILKNIAAMTLSVSTVMTVLFYFFRDEIIGFFADGDASVIAVGEYYFPIAALLFYAGALRAVMNALINGSGNTAVNFATAIFDGIVMRLGLAVLFGMVLKMEYYGFWLGDALAGFTPFVIGSVFYVSGRWKKNMPVVSEE